MSHFLDHLPKKDREFIVYAVTNDGVSEVQRCHNAHPSGAARKGASRNIKNILVVDKERCSKAIKDWRKTGLPVKFLDANKLGLHTYVGKKRKLREDELSDHARSYGMKYKSKALKCHGDTLVQFLDSHLFHDFLETYEDERQLRADKAREYRHMHEALDDIEDEE